MTWYENVISGLLSASFICLSSCEQQEGKSYKSSKVETTSSKITHERNLELSSAEHPPKIKVRPVDERNEIQKVVEEKLRQIIVPIIDFEDTPVSEALDYLRVRTLELHPNSEPQMSGVSMVIQQPRHVDQLQSETVHLSESLKITELRLRNVSIWDALEKITQQSGLDFWIDPEYGRVIISAPKD